MGVHPYQLNEYTPHELQMLLLYADAKREQIERG